jgi:hypothetical protein
MAIYTKKGGMINRSGTMSVERGQICVTMPGLDAGGGGLLILATGIAVDVVCRGIEDSEAAGRARPPWRWPKSRRGWPVPLKRDRAG